MFKLWITIVILHLLLTVGVVFAEEHDVCKSEQKYSQIWYYNECDDNEPKIEIKKVYEAKQPDKNNPWKGWENGTSNEIPSNAIVTDEIQIPKISSNHPYLNKTKNPSERKKECSLGTRISYSESIQPTRIKAMR